MIASKYRIAIQPSRVEKFSHVTLIVLFVATVWMWQPDIMPYQTLIQAVLSLVIFVVLIKSVRFQHSASTISLSDDGEWLDLDKQTAFRITQASRVTSWLLWVQLASTSSNKKEWRWIYKDAVEDQNFRRLARVIMFIQRRGELGDTA